MEPTIQRPPYRAEIKASDNQVVLSVPPHSPQYVAARREADPYDAPLYRVFYIDAYREPYGVVRLDLEQSTGIEDIEEMDPLVGPGLKIQGYDRLYEPANLTGPVALACYPDELLDLVRHEHQRWTNSLRGSTAYAARRVVSRLA